MSIRSAKIIVGKTMWFLDDHLYLHARTPTSIKMIEDDEYDTFEVRWESDTKDDDYYFKEKTYCDERKINRQQMSFETRQKALNYAIKMANDSKQQRKMSPIGNNESKE